jgi:hypothetical protein
VLRIQFKGKRKTGDLIISIPGRVGVMPQIIVPAGV